jgi:CheY-like chemotaxis protein/tetratricopeptide (TPR) repeat protein
VLAADRHDAVANTILYIDDEPDLAATLAERLEPLGHRLTHVEHAEEALALMRSGAVDLVLIEPQLTTCDGLELLEQVCRIGSQNQESVPAVVLTRGGRTPALYGRALELGVREFLTKPVTASQLIASIEGALAEGTEDRDEASWAEPSSAAELNPEGELDELLVPELLHRLHARGYSGLVILKGGDDRLGVQLRNGSPAAVSSTEGKETAEDFLLRTGRITAEQHEELVGRLFVGLGGPRDVLAAMGILSEEEIEAALLEHAEEPLLRTFGWTTGSYRLLPGKKLKGAEAHEIGRSLQGLLVDGVLRHSPDEQLRGQLAQRGALYVSRAVDEDIEGWVADLTLTPELRELLETMQGDRTVAEIVASGEVDVRSFYALVLGGALELHLEPILLLVEETAEVGETRHDEGCAPQARPPADREAVRRVEEFSCLAGALAQQDDFSVLEVSELASDEDVRRAYHAQLEALGVAGPKPEDPRMAQLVEQIRGRVTIAYRHLQDVESRDSYAAARREEEKARAAREEAARALEAEGWFRKGERFLRSKRYDEAVEAFGMSAHLDPEEGEYVSHLGWALYLKQPDDDLVRREALEQIARGIKLSPRRALPYVYLGRIFKAIDDPEHARKMFRKATKVDPDCHPALQELRLLEMRDQKHKGVLGRLRKM